MVRRYRSAAGTRPNSIQLRGAPPRRRALEMHRRGFLQTLGLGSLAASALSRTTASAAAVVKPRRLTAGDTVALISPATATFQSLDVQIARESLEALGLKTRV